MTCPHPHDAVHTVDIVTSRGGSVTVCNWCGACGSFRTRKSVADLNDLAQSPWKDWESPKARREGA